MMNLIIALQEKHVVDLQTAHVQSISRLYDQLNDMVRKMTMLRENVKKTSAEYHQLLNKCGTKLDISDNALSVVSKDDFFIRVKRINLHNSIAEYEQLEQQVNELERRIKDLEDRPPPDQYLSVRDRYVLDWHMANLEFANAIPLDQLSLANWSQDDEYELKGAHLIVKNGYSVVPNILAEGLNLKLNTKVSKVIYGSDQEGVKVVCMTSDGKTETLKADCCLCTIPLGVLKESIEASSDKITEATPVDFKKPPLFIPPLPSWKSEAVNRLGFGNLNKIILCFDTPFWDTSINIFGHVAEDSAPRGECFLFWTCWSAPVMLALVSGVAADEIEHVSDEEAVGRCMRVLRGIFGESSVPTPRDSVVTRWRADQFSRGSYSHIAVGSTGDDYDIMSAPVKANEIETQPKLFFAGEHTMRQFPASVHGALLSGFREAGRIAQLLLDDKIGS